MVFINRFHPKKCNSIYYESQITLRNLIWPGYLTYHNDYKFGYAYFGDGIKNSDFEFLL